jgi:hypothetical protein
MRRGRRVGDVVCFTSPSRHYNVHLLTVFLEASVSTRSSRTVCVSDGLMLAAENVRERGGYDVLVRKHDHQQRCESLMQNGVQREK